MQCVGLSLRKDCARWTPHTTTVPAQATGALCLRDSGEIDMEIGVPFATRLAFSAGTVQRDVQRLQPRHGAASRSAQVPQSLRSRSDAIGIVSLALGLRAGVRGRCRSSVRAGDDLRSFLLGEEPKEKEKPAAPAEPEKPAKPASTPAPKAAAKPASTPASSAPAPKAAAKPASTPASSAPAPKAAAKPASTPASSAPAPKAAAKPASTPASSAPAPKAAAKPASTPASSAPAPKAAAKPASTPAPKAAAKPASSSPASSESAAAKKHLQDALHEVEPEKAPEWAKLNETFALLDSDGNGHISKDELISVVKDHGVDEKEVLKALEEVDADQDGEINYAEFVKLMKS